MSARRLHALVLALGFALGSACSPESPQGTQSAEAQGEPLDFAIEGILEAIEEKQSGSVLEHVSYEFQSDDELDFADVRAIVDTYLLRDGTLGVRLESLTIEGTGVEGEQRAQAWLSFAPGTRLASDTPLPESAVTYSFDLVFAYREGRWQALRGAYARQ